jgi:hypothetical protein
MEQVTQVCSKGILLESGAVHFYGDSVQAAEIYSDLASKHQVNAEANEYFNKDVTLENIWVSSEILYGGIFVVQLDVLMKKKVRNADLHISIHNKSRQVISRIYTKITENSFELNEGINKITANIGPNYLPRGEYTISIALLNQSNNEHLYWGNHIKQISVSGPPINFNGCVPPVQIKLT